MLYSPIFCHVCRLQVFVISIVSPQYLHVKCSWQLLWSQSWACPKTEEGKLCEVHMYLSSVCQKWFFYLPFGKQLITTRTTEEHLCNNCFLHQAQSFLSYLLSLLNHRQLARRYFNGSNQWRNTRFVVGSTSLHEPLHKSINGFLRALGFKRKFPSKNIITKFKQPWKAQLKQPRVPP